MEVLIALVVLLLLIFLRIPLFLALTIVGLVGFYIITGNWNASVLMAAQRVIDTTQNYNLSVVPLFILMGQIISQSGLAASLYRSAHAILWKFPGSHCLTTIATCGLLSSLSGSSIATTATVGPMAMTNMRRRGYADSLSTGSIVAGSTLGIIIPPSVMLVIYGIMTETSIRELFVAGIGPGILGMLLYGLTVLWIVKKRSNSAPIELVKPSKLCTKDIKWTILLVGLVILTLGGIYTGFFTPTESASVGVLGVLVLSFVKNQLPISGYLQAVIDTVKTSSAIFLVVIGSLVFSNFVNVAQFTQWFTGFIDNIGGGIILTLGLFLLAYIILGLFLESMSLLLLTVPIFFPITAALGIDPIWFGIIIIIMIELSLITPPIGMNIFTLQSVVPDTSLKDIYKGAIPFCIANIIRAILVVAFPSIALLLPTIVY